MKKSLTLTVECPNPRCPSKPFNVQITFKKTHIRQYSGICPYCKQIVYYSMAFHRTYWDSSQYRKMLYQYRKVRRKRHKVYKGKILKCPKCGKKGYLYEVYEFGKSIPSYRIVRHDIWRNNKPSYKYHTY
jgi:hypothetical protein